MNIVIIILIIIIYRKASMYPSVVGILKCHQPKVILAVLTMMQTMCISPSIKPETRGFLFFFFYLRDI